MTHSRERLAWAVLLLSFATCLALAVGIPLAAQDFVRTARVGQEVAVEPQRGTPRMQRGGQGEIIALVGLANNVPAGTVLTTDASDQGILTLYAPGPEPEVVAEATIYGDTTVTLVTARSPRFHASPLPHEVVLEVARGRVRVAVSPAFNRQTVVELRTPHLTARLSEGSYEARVWPALSELAVREGTAQASAGGDTVTLGPSQRTVAHAGTSPLQTLPAERNLLSNGTFSTALEETWEVYTGDVQHPPEGTVEATTLGGRPAAHFYRDGIGHAEIGIRQQIGYDVRDFTSLTLHLNLLIRYQSLTGCGILGSECPIMVRIDYKDIYGTDRVWYHGFYSVAASPDDLLPGWDEQTPLGTWFTYESGNLIELFEEPPASVTAVTIYASGHSFDALVTGVELLAAE